MALASDDNLGEILVVDDTLADRQFLTDILTSQGYNVRSASSGEHALEQVDLSKPDLVLLDIDMPGMDGFTLCRELKQRTALATVPVIFISSFDDTSNKVAAFNCGGIDYVTKPFKVAEIKARIRTHLQIKRSQDRLGFQALHDVLTGLPNRKLLVDRLHHSLSYAERYGSQVAVVYIDLDDFKEINDRYGHDAGDQLLTEVARRLLDSVRESDTVARMGGDEFALIFHDHPDEEMTLAALQRILKRLEEPIPFGQYSLKTRGSIGFSLYPHDGSDTDALLKNADTAMYHAKQIGGNNFQRYTHELHSRVNERINLDKSLRCALDGNEFVLHYQPRVDLRSGQIIGLEALIRWQHPVLGLLSPQRFLPLAEDLGLIDQIGDWVLRTACRQSKAWEQAGVATLPIAINISGAQFLKKGFAQSVAAILCETDVTAASIELDIRESLSMQDPTTTIRVFNELKTMGIGLSIDDFGTGYSNLSFLKQFPLDKVKLDLCFVGDMEHSPKDLAISGAVITLAHSLNLKVTAEGVENEAQLALLRARGCDEVQGFYFSPPLPVEACARLLQENRAFSMHGTDQSPTGRTILLVDEDDKAIEGLVRHLAPSGYEILTASGGSEALNLLGRHQVGVILCNDSLQDMSGAELLNKIKRLYPHTVRMLVGGETDVNVLVQAINQGSVFRIWHKPWSPQELLTMVSDAFDKHESRMLAGAGESQQA